MTENGMEVKKIAHVRANESGILQAAWDPISVKYLAVWPDFRNDADHDLQCETGEATCADIRGQSLPSAGATLSAGPAFISNAGHQFDAALVSGAAK